MPKTLKRPIKISKATLPQHVQRYIDSKKLADEAAARVKQQRDTIIAYAEEHGVEDSNGHQWVEVGDFARIKRERRVATVMDEEYVEEWLRKNKLWDQCSRTITVIDEDALYAAIYDETIPEQVADKMFTHRETFALKVEEL